MRGDSRGTTLGHPSFGQKGQAEEFVCVRYHNKCHRKSRTTRIDSYRRTKTKSESGRTGRRQCYKEPEVAAAIFNNKEEKIFRYVEGRKESELNEGSTIY